MNKVNEASPANKVSDLERLVRRQYSKEVCGESMVLLCNGKKMNIDDAIYRLEKADELLLELMIEVAALKKGNTALIDSLMGMVNQFFIPVAGDDGLITHSFMSAEEDAIDVLMQAGFAENIAGETYRLKWDALEERKQRLQAGDFYT